MTLYYPGRTVIRYFSRLDPDAEFRNPEDAEQHDRRRAVEIVAGTDGDALLNALESSIEPELALALAFLHDAFLGVPIRSEIG